MTWKEASIDRLAWLTLALMIGGCAAFGPPAIVLSRGEISERAFIDRSGAGLSKVFRQFEGLDVSGPDVGFQTQAQRIELGWSISLKEAPLGIPLTIRIAISGRPELNPQANGVDLLDSRIEEIRLPSIPFVNIDTRSAEGDSLGRIPLLAFQPDELNRDGLVYRATGLSLGTFGLRVDLAPK